MKYPILLAMLLLGVTTMRSQAYIQDVSTEDLSFQQHRELGHVHWIRDYDKAIELSEKWDKPILLLFQEVPGCQTCVNYGQQSLSHPLMLEMIEHHFIPLAIFNNKKGKDVEILNQFNERSWNNPVVHFIDEKGQDIAPVLRNDFHPLGLHAAIEVAMKKAGKDLPAYFELIASDLKLMYRPTHEANFKTSCFWSGESKLATMDGVLATEPGWNEDGEVVKVIFDAREADQRTLEKEARTLGYGASSSEAFRIDKDPQYYLKQSKYRYVLLSPAQRTAINSALGSRHADPSVYLTPKQRHMLSSDSKKNANAYRMDIVKVWPYGEVMQGINLDR